MGPVRCRIAPHKRFLAEKIIIRRHDDHPYGQASTRPQFRRNSLLSTNTMPSGRSGWPHWGKPFAQGGCRNACRRTRTLTMRFFPVFHFRIGSPDSGRSDFLLAVITQVMQPTNDSNPHNAYSHSTLSPLRPSHLDRVTRGSYKGGPEMGRIARNDVMTWLWPAVHDPHHRAAS
jgi:hypothetical protein